MKKKSKFLTFIFSMMPGAGHMYLGFMKHGVSIMTLFFGAAFLGMSTGSNLLMLVFPVIWFYSFFDALNKNGLPDDEFYALEDHFLFNLDQEDFKDFQFGKFRIVAAIILIIIGSSMLLSNMMSIFSRILPIEIYQILDYLVGMLPEVFIGFIIIFIGVKLIIGKNTELKKEAFLQITEREVFDNDENA